MRVVDNDDDETNNVSYQRIDEVQVKRRSGDAPPLTAWSVSSVAAFAAAERWQRPFGRTEKLSDLHGRTKEGYDLLGRTVGRRSSDQRGQERRPNS